MVSSGSFKKDLKRYANNVGVMHELESIVEFLRSDTELPQKYKTHRLSGVYAGFMECHVKNDVLLIWIAPDANEIVLSRLGSHSELFGKGRKR